MTLSEAFHKSGEGDDAMSATLSLTEDHYPPHRCCRTGSSSCGGDSRAYSHSPLYTPSLISTVSSVTLSRALNDNMERHEHYDHGFYVATRLGDFVEDTNACVPPPHPLVVPIFEDDIYEDGYGGMTESTEVEEKKNLIASVDDSGGYCSGGNHKCDSADIIDDVLSDGGVTGFHSSTTTTKTGAGCHIVLSMTGLEVIGTDILDLLPDCGVPIPSVMTHAGITRAQSSRQGGMLLPCHSARSIQNYCGRKGTKNKGRGVDLS